MSAKDDTRNLLEHIIREVQARSPVDLRERLSIERFVVEIGRLTEPMSEHANPVHITASGIVTGSRGVLLHRHRLLGIWVAPGGHIDAGETPGTRPCAKRQKRLVSPSLAATTIRNSCTSTFTADREATRTWT
jgi:8-oxo-dGTP pyrophosphatase MutT (NUDIX family)